MAADASLHPETPALHAGWRADPAAATHSQLSPEDRLSTGVSDGYVRLSIGLEHIDDILADLERGLSAAGTLARAA